MNKRSFHDQHLNEASVELMGRSPCMYGGDIHPECRQAREEGRDLSGGLDKALQKHIAFRLYPGNGKFDSFKKMDVKWWRHAFELLDEVQARPILKSYSYHEPNDLPSILKARPKSPVAPLGMKKLSRTHLEARIYDAFMGRLVGSQLGAPLEGYYRENMRIYCEETEGYPMANYLRHPTKTELSKIKRRKATQFFDKSRPNPFLRENITYSCENDDINFTIMNLKILAQYGAGFTPLDVASFWISFVGDGCSAEGVAIRNLEAGIAPPHSASFRNPYREWIGAQIRGDFFGYANPGNSERAAAWGWRDGVVTHVRNGVYGEMWIAAAIAAAFYEKGAKAVILAGLAQIPKNCRLAEGLHRVIAQYNDSMGFEEFMNDFHKRYDQHDYQDWTHVIPNAEICAASLLWGDEDFDKTLAYSVLPGFDTDCNAATVGSILGLWHGREGIPSKWVKPFNGKYRMGFGQGFHTIESIEKTASEMTDVALKNLNEHTVKKPTTQTIKIV